MNQEPPNDLKQLAVDIVDGKVFTDRHCQKPEDLGMVFLVLNFMEGDQIKELGEKGMFFEYMDKAGPRSVNGYPQFFSMQTLTKEEADQVIAHVVEYREAKKAFLGPRQ